MNLTFVGLLSLGILASCSNGSEFSSNSAKKQQKGGAEGKGDSRKDPPPSAPPSEDTPREAPLPRREKVDAAPAIEIEGIPKEEPPPEDPLPDTGDEPIAVDPSTLDVRKTLSFTYGADQDKYDYVLVMDNSVSMKGIAAKVKDGFLAILSQPGVFPTDALMAVMSTMTGDESDLATTGKGINRYQGIDAEPGFLDFVHKGAIQSYKPKTTAKFAAAWPLEGCEQRWFKPEDKDATGRYCLESALQISGASVGAEPGIHAFKQLLQKNAGKALFRPNAVVNVIFVSDTHDPGVDNNALRNSIPSYADIKSLADQSNTIRSLRFHAIAPETICTKNEELHTKSYFKIAADSNGSKADVCTLASYGEFLKKTILESKSGEPVFKLERPASEIVAVYVDDVAVKDFEVSPTKDSITINGLDPSKKSIVKIEYLAPP